MEASISEDGRASFQLDWNIWADATGGTVLAEGVTVTFSCVKLMPVGGVLACTGDSRDLRSRLDSKHSEGWTASDPYPLNLSDSKGKSIGSTAVTFTDSRPLALSSIEILAENLELIRGYDPLELDIATRALSPKGATAEATFAVLVDGKIKDATFEKVTSLSSLVDVSDLADGAHILTVEASNGQSELSRDITFNLLTPVVSNLEISTPKTFYPVKDGYQDDLRISVTVETNLDRQLGGQGTIQVTTSTGALIKSFKFSSTGSKSFTLPGIQGGKALKGKIRVTAGFSLAGQETETKSAVVDASPKRVVETTGTTTTSAWQSKIDCGPSYHPCNRKGLNNTSFNGIELYSDPIGGDHSSRFGVKVPSGTYKWKVRLNAFRTGVLPPSFRAYSDSGKYLGSLPSSVDFYGSWTSAWVFEDSTSKAYWTLQAEDGGYVWFESVTVTWVARTLK